MNELTLTPSDFVAFVNQTLETAYPSVIVEGELSNFRVSKNKWIYFDLKDELASVKFFGTVYQLPGPLEDGLMLRARGMPRLHPQFGFSVTIQTIQPVGEGSIKKAAALLEAKLAAEGLFDPARKRILPYPPVKIGLITSGESAAYADFMKIINQRWGGLEIQHANVQVQGESAPAQIIAAVEHFNSHADPVEVLVITRGGGSAEDLAAFSTEQVTRAVAASRVPTLVAIGHEVDLSLAEMAADQRASTPSNAAELLVPDKKHILANLPAIRREFAQLLDRVVDERQKITTEKARQLSEVMQRLITDEKQRLKLESQLLNVLNPLSALKRGYAVVRLNGKVIKHAGDVKKGELITAQLTDGQISSRVEGVK